LGYYDPTSAQNVKEPLLMDSIVYDAGRIHYSGKAVSKTSTEGKLKLTKENRAEWSGQPK